MKGKRLAQDSGLHTWQGFAGIESFMYGPLTLLQENANSGKTEQVYIDLIQYSSGRDFMSLLNFSLSILDFILNGDFSVDVAVH